jgi:hypothetical protein
MLWSTDVSVTQNQRGRHRTQIIMCRRWNASIVNYKTVLSPTPWLKKRLGQIMDQVSVSSSTKFSNVKHNYVALQFWPVRNYLRRSWRWPIKWSTINILIVQYAVALFLSIIRHCPVHSAWAAQLSRNTESFTAIIRENNKNPISACVLVNRWQLQLIRNHCNCGENVPDDASKYLKLRRNIQPN